MSAFVLSDKFFSQLAAELYQRSYENSFSYILRDVADYDNGASDEETKARIEGLMSKLRDANYSAVNQRYGVDEQPATLEFVDAFSIWSDTQLFKNLRCLRYQMSEGTVYDSAIYNKLNEFISSVAEYIVSKTEEYDTANWGR